MRFHVLGIPHTVTDPEYSSCAFTQKVVKLCRMLMMEGHEVFHYGHEGSNVHTTEHVTVTNDSDLDRSFPGWNWRTQGFPPFTGNELCNIVFNTIVPIEIMKRYRPGDMLLCSFGLGHKAVADACPMVTPVETGIGYPHGTFAKFRIFESYACMHAYQGIGAAAMAGEGHWYDAVIPNAFDIDQFHYTEKKEDFFLFLGRQNVGKGIHIAKDMACKLDIPLYVAGQGTQGADTTWVKYLGLLGPGARATVLAQARFTICASTFLEPFCGVQIESMISGTPVISSDWGAFAEYNRHGRTGYRCRTFEQFMWAANHIGRIDPVNCRKWGERFSLEKIAPRYTDYLQSVQDVISGKGFYELHPERTTLLNSSNFPG